MTGKWVGRALCSLSYPIPYIYFDFNIYSVQGAHLDQVVRRHGHAHAPEAHIDASPGQLLQAMSSDPQKISIASAKPGLDLHPRVLPDLVPHEVRTVVFSLRNRLHP